MGVGRRLDEEDGGRQLDLLEMGDTGMIRRGRGRGRSREKDLQYGFSGQWPAARLVSLI